MAGKYFTWGGRIPARDKDRFVTTFDLCALNPEDGTETKHRIIASTLAEALTILEREDAGIRTRIYGIAPRHYDKAKAEGIAFNEADGLLIDGGAH